MDLRTHFDDTTILAAARRIANERFLRGQTITSAGDSISFLRTHLEAQRSEVFAALFLDNRHRVIAFEILFYGTIDGASVYPRVLVERSLAHNSAAVILAHNHPSGLAEPSDADVKITQRLQEALALIDVRLLDHIVIGIDTVSLADEGLI